VLAAIPPIKLVPVGTEPPSVKGKLLLVEIFKALVDEPAEIVRVCDLVANISEESNV
jgi:hypothetical protein